jgi:hypothetical protein
MKYLVQILFISIIVNFAYSQSARDPRSKKEANLNWNGEFALYSLDSDIEIVPTNTGAYTFWYASEEDPTPKLISISKAKSIKAYKFLSFEECSKWCKYAQKSLGINILQPIDEQFKIIDNFFKQNPSDSLNKNTISFTKIIDQESYDSDYSALNNIIGLKQELINEEIKTEKKIKSYSTRTRENYTSTVEEWYLNATKGDASFLSVNQMKTLIKKGLMDIGNIDPKSIDPNSCCLVTQKVNEDRISQLFFFYYQSNGWYPYVENFKYFEFDELDSYVKKFELKSLSEVELKNKLKELTFLDEDYFNSKTNLAKLKEQNSQLNMRYFTLLNNETIYCGLTNTESRLRENNAFCIIYNLKRDTLFVGHWVGELPSLNDNYKLFINATEKHSTLTKIQDRVFTTYAPNGDIYMGQVANNGERNGNGTYFYNSGSYYVGAWVNGYCAGNGTKYFKNGDIWSGEWKNNKFSGMGKQTLKNGQVKEGLFENDILVKSNSEITKEKQILQKQKEDLLLENQQKEQSQINNWKGKSSLTEIECDKLFEEYSKAKANNSLDLAISLISVHIEKCNTTDKNYAYGYYWRAELYILKSDYNKAISDLKQALTRFSNQSKQENMQLSTIDLLEDCCQKLGDSKNQQYYKNLYSQVSKKLDDRLSTVEVREESNSTSGKNQKFCYSTYTEKYELTLFDDGSKKVVYKLYNSNGTLQKTVQGEWTMQGLMGPGNMLIINWTGANSSLSTQYVCQHDGWGNLQGLTDTSNRSWNQCR